MAFDSAAMYGLFGTGFPYQGPVTGNPFGTGLESPFIGNRSYPEPLSARTFLPQQAGYGMGTPAANPLLVPGAGAISPMNAPPPYQRSTYRSSPWAQRAGVPSNQGRGMTNSMPSSAPAAQTQTRRPPSPPVRGQHLGGTGVSGFSFPFQSQSYPAQSAPTQPPSFPFAGFQGSTDPAATANARTSAPQRASATRAYSGAGTATAGTQACSGQYAADGRVPVQVPPPQYSESAVPPEYVEQAMPPEYVEPAMPPREYTQAPAAPAACAEEPPAVAKKHVDTEVPIVHGRTYHLPAKGPVGDGQEIARRIMLVGDPGRVGLVAKAMDRVEYQAENREIRVATGLFKGVWVTCISSGMGPDNTEIVMTELHVLNEYDSDNGVWRKDFEPLILLRVGTCGSPSDAVSVGDLAVSSHAVGADNIGKWYVRRPAVARRADDPAAATNPPREVVERAVKAAVPEAEGWLYATNASGAMVNAIRAAGKAITPHRGVHVGITWTAPGFYAPQGRAVGRLASRLLVPDLPTRLYELRVPVAPDAPPLKVTNLEMESASLFHLAGELGYIAGAVCLVIAARPPDPAYHKFLVEGKETAIKEACLVGLEALIHLGNQKAQSNWKAQAHGAAPAYDSADARAGGPETADIPMPGDAAGNGPPPGAVEALD